ncbi:MAG TPA: serine hydrolase [Terriglobales bacterium]|nr:serine hydrolase [Terriglobales bacterium]
MKIGSSQSGTRSLLMRMLLETALFLLLAGTCWGQRPQANPLAPKTKAPAPVEEAAKAGSHEMTPDDVAAFLDGIMPQQLAKDDIAGAVISVVKDGKVIFAKGYGYSDVAKKTPVSADNTLFRPGSISKLFTWTAVMQLVEQGKLDLDRDVNDYLDFTIPATYPKPITLRNIMTHTPGFEEVIQELFVKDAKDLKPLGDYLKQHLPARIFPPGTTPAYSNYATAMAGYIVQRVSGQDYFDYIDEHILKPLNMTHSTFRQPLPESLKGLMSMGYDVGSQPAKDFEYVEAAPAGSSSVSAMDITHFMIAHLQDGKYEAVQILKPETARLMHSRQFANLPAMNGMCLGFYEETRNGHRIIGHGGDTQYFHSDLHLVPDAQLGFFVSYNSAGKSETSEREAVWHAILDRYFPYQPPQGEAVSNSAQDVQSVSGHYIVSRRSEKTILKVLTPTGEAKVYGNDDGTVSASDLKDPNGEPKKFREIAPLLFRDVNGQDQLGFKRDAAGNLVAVIDFPFMVFQKAAWYENSAFQLPLIIVSLIVIVLAVILWPVMALIRRHYRTPLTLTPQQRRVRLLVRFTCVMIVVFFTAYATFFALAFKDIGLLSPRVNPWLRLIQIVGWLGILGTIVAIYGALQSWRTPQRWLAARIGDTLIALGCLGVVWFVFTWNLLHWSLKY